jgi:hypothetical protein
LPDGAKDAPLDAMLQTPSAVLAAAALLAASAGAMSRNG